MILFLITLFSVNFLGFYVAYISRKQMTTTFLDLILDTFLMRVIIYTLGILGILIGLAMYDNILN